MPGQCYGCGAEFGIFKKEHGCKNCGFAFCSKCLADKSIAVPKRNNSKHRVCVKCFTVLSGQAAPDVSETSYELPEAYLKRVAALKEKESGHAAHGLPGTGQKIPAHLRKMDKADRDIAMRLEKLRDSGKPKAPVTDQDLNARLAQLKDQTYEPAARPTYQGPDRRLAPQQVDDLLEEIAAEVEIDSHRPDPAEEVEARLAKLRSANGAGGCAPDVDTGTGRLDSQQGQPNSQHGHLENNLNTNGQSGAGGKPLYRKNISSLTDSGQEVDMAEMQALMEEAAHEMEVDARRAIRGMEQDEELMKRLREIQSKKEDKRNKGAGLSSAGSDSDNTAQENVMARNTSTGDDSDDDEDEDAAAKRIIQRFLEEAKIDERVGGARSVGDSKASGEHGAANEKSLKASRSGEELKPSNLQAPRKEELVDSDYDDSDELPYCCICTEDAMLRCRDCDLDLYCQRCFRECHAEMGLTDHKTTQYRAPRGYRN